jgi:hypothetical protein
MAGSTTILDTISVSQAQKEVTANALFDAASAAMLFGRRASTSSGLTWGYYGGPIRASGSPGGLTQIPNGELELDASSTCFKEVDSEGVVSFNTSGFTPGNTPLYEITTNADGVVSYIDWRITTLGQDGAVSSVNGAAGDVVLGAEDILASDAGGYYTASDVAGQLQEVGAALDAAGSATLAGLTDVDIDGSPSPADRSVLTFDADSETWRAASPVAGTETYAVVLAEYAPAPTASQKLISPLPAVLAHTFAGNFTGSSLTATVAATASTVFDIQKNGASIGTATFAAAGTTATLATTGGAAQAFAVGDKFALIAPATPDATLAGLAGYFVATKD